MKRCDPRKEKTIGIGDFRDWTDEKQGKGEDKILQTELRGVA